MVVYYHHHQIGKKEWQYIDVRYYTGHKQKEWLDHVDNWHAQLSTVALQYTKWWWLLSSSRLNPFYTPILKPLFYAFAIIKILEKGIIFNINAT